MSTISTVFIFAVLMALSPAIGAGDSTSTSSYAGQETRQIKSLSAADIAELRRGGGWGLAKVAELNGVPGPIHLLDLKNAIPLAPDQVIDLESMYAAMREEAIVVGNQLINAEAALDQAFASGLIDNESLRVLLSEAERQRSELRYIHLSRHLATLEILQANQITRYGRLRGYGNDSCDSVPDGHDAELWRRHNGCD